jgi:2-oxoglutarate ferredoxin oxidoreductase subunit gamma
MEQIQNSASRIQMIKCAGFGGQGILALGEIIAIAAMYEGKNVSWLPSYGPESRGGTCNCDVILSDDEIAAPVVDTPNVAFIFSQPSMDKFEPNVVEGGILFYDVSLAKVARERERVHYVGIPFTSLGIELGTEKVANMVALGAYIGHMGYPSPGAAIRAMRSRFAGKERFFAINEKAIATGMDYLRKMRNAECGV